MGGRRSVRADTAWGGEGDVPSLPLCLTPLFPPENSVEQPHPGPRPAGTVRGGQVVTRGVTGGVEGKKEQGSMDSWRGEGSETLQAGVVLSFLAFRTRRVHGGYRG